MEKVVALKSKGELTRTVLKYETTDGLKNFFKSSNFVSSDYWFNGHSQVKS